ncbi:hypothetical protein ABZ464_20390 [Streptomyces sp. NPDC005820]|uniref:hypothetical protein n=1 Tax=Streptomyces sp. NPDC005820 TaxID=3157069 RepID=UPI0033F5F103
MAPIELRLAPGFPGYARHLLEKAARLIADPHENAGAVLLDGTGAEFAASTADLADGCAEPVVVDMARRAGLLDLRVLALVTAGAPNTGVTLPCGGCRQILWEAAFANDRDIEIYCADASLSEIVLVTATELLPR